MNESSPKVSIVLPTYNGAKYIWQSIDSCLNQTHKNIELIIVDDGSIDETYQIIRSHQDKRVKYIRHEKNKGLPRALNAGFAKATGEYLTWTSDDNYYAKKAIEKMLSFLKNKPCEFVYCDFYIFNENKISGRNLIASPDSLNLKDNNFIGPCFLYSAKVKEVIGNYHPDTELAEDYDYWIRISKKFSIAHLKEPLYFYRIHKKSLFSTRYREIQIVTLLVKIKNDILDIEPATDLLINFIARNISRYVKLNKILVKILFSKKIGATLRNFKTRKISLKIAELNLISINNKLISILRLPILIRQTFQKVLKRRT